MTELLYQFSKKLEDKTAFIHVVGDSMLDIDYQAIVNRISPECPNVNILLSESDVPFRQLAGGAANVCCQLNNFNVTSRLFSVTDIEAYNIIRSNGIKYWGGVFLPDGYYVPRKKRFYNKQQVVARWDIEKTKYGLDSLHDLQNALINNWRCFQAEPDVIIFSDYNKGLFSGRFNLSQFKTKAITIVDPKAELNRWRNCTIFKPNAKEAEILSGYKDWQQQCDFFKKELNCKAVVVTQEGDGVVGKTHDYFEYRPHCKIRPLDIVGAGDCFISMLALAISCGFSVEDASQIAFHGGLLYVQRERGTFGPWVFHSSGKILKNWDFLKSRKYKISFTNGCFDLLHTGHLQTLEAAKSKGDKLIVAVNSDESIKRLKGDNRPVLPLEERMRLLAALDCVDFVVSFEEDTPVNLIKDICPDVLVKGADWLGKEVAGSEYVKEMCYVPVIKGHSTTEIISKIKS